MSAGVEVSNETDLPLEEESFARLTEQVLGEQGARGMLALAFVSEETMAGLNFTYRGQDGPTDVLSFPEERDPDWPSPEQDEHLGDVVICPAYAARNAQADGIGLNEELIRLVVHGVLHILGWDHETDEGEMLRLQDELLARLDRPPLLLGPA